ncbi:AAA family ATPase [Actinoplanes sp. NPDC024001]|uniref:ATP-binding protein n=1 Tax=Actinoplanes sp. NPDC024001 TaxID=3154598 RepID=UPI003400EE9C
MLEARLFGAFALSAPDTPVTPASARARSLLAYLALRPDIPHPRDRVAFLLWPDSTASQARTNLRHLLHTLRRSVPALDAHLVTGAGTLTLHHVRSDVADFDAALAKADSAEDPTPWLRAAADLYTGDLLDSCYDDWPAGARDDYRRRAGAALDRLVPLLESSGDPHAAVRYAEQARRLDPLAEAPYRNLMRLHDALGDRARAIRVYHEYTSVLADELGVDPSPRVREQYEALLPRHDPTPRRGGGTPYVGRRTERQRLTGLWRDAAAGASHLVVVTGEPGIGKTRLVEEFRHWVAHQGAAHAFARSYPAEGTLAYAPLAAWLRDLGPARWRARLTAAQLATLAVLLPELPVDPAPPEPGARLRLFDAVAAALRDGDRPVLLVADDLHAADPATCQFVHYLLRTGSRSPLLLAATARPAETDPGHPAHILLAELRARGHCTELPLERLDRAQTGALAARHGHSFSERDLTRLHTETEGNPLFIVEALRAGWHGGGTPPVLTPRVQAVLESRLLQLSDGARELLGVAATAGSSVSVDVLARAHPGGADRVAPDLDELWRRELLLTGGGDTYDFSHDKLREVAYRRLSPAGRRRNHELLARALPEVHAGRLDLVAGQVAAHLRAAGKADEAVGWYVRAATAASHRYADANAADLLHQAWESVRSDPGTDRELELLSRLPGPLVAAEGYASRRLRTVLDRAFTIAARLGTEPGAPLLRARAMAELSRGEFEAARESGARLCALGADDNVLAVEGHFVQGVAAAWRNETALARMHLRAAVDRYRPENRSAHLLAYSQDPQVLCLARLAHVHFCSGEPARARTLQGRAVELGRAVGHPFTLAAALLFAALLDLDLADLGSLRGRAGELAALCDRVEAPPIRLCAQAMTGYLAVLDGSAGPGLDRIDAALADPGRDSAPGVPAILLRIRLAAAQAAGLTGEATATARRLLAGNVRVWDATAREALSG